MSKGFPVITFVGHVDHGKSSLLGKLTLLSHGGSNMVRQFDKQMPSAHLLDQLQEERERDMTIDTSCMTLQLGGQRVDCIDCPGHFELVKNMVSGASRADLAVLVLDVTQGVAPQTIKHFEIVEFLGIPKCLVAINKLDCVADPERAFTEAQKAFRERFGQSSVDVCHFAPVSALNGWGIADTTDMPFYPGPCLADAILEALKPETTVRSPLLFPIQQVVGDWCLGTVKSGTVRVGDTVQLSRAGKTATVAGILDFPKDIGEATAPASVAIRLKEINLPLADELLTEPTADYGQVSQATTPVVWLDQTQKWQDGELTISSFNQRTTVRVSVTSEKKNELQYGDIGEVQLALNQPFVVFRNPQHKALNRFVISRGGAVVGGGFLSCT